MSWPQCTALVLVQGLTWWAQVVEDLWQRTWGVGAELPLQQEDPRRASSRLSASRTCKKSEDVASGGTQCRKYNNDLLADFFGKMYPCHGGHGQNALSVWLCTYARWQPAPPSELASELVGWRTSVS